MAEVFKGLNLQALFCHRKHISLLASLLAFLPLVLHAQTTWPTRAVTIVVPFTPGGGTDVGTRVVAQRLSQLWGQPVLIENRAGAGGNVGLEAVSRAKPDGYTLLTGNVGTQSINPTLYKKLNYNVLIDFIPVASIGDAPQVVSARKDFPATGLDEFAAYLKLNAAKLNFGAAGVGSGTWLGGQLINVKLGVKVNAVNYRAPLARLNSPTFGRANSPRQDGLIINHQCRRAQGARRLL